LSGFHIAHPTKESIRRAVVHNSLLYRIIGKRLIIRLLGMEIISCTRFAVCALLFILILLSDNVPIYPVGLSASFTGSAQRVKKDGGQFSVAAGNQAPDRSSRADRAGTPRKQVHL
jgi:hypothetical protein